MKLSRFENRSRRSVRVHRLLGVALVQGLGHIGRRPRTSLLSRQYVGDRWWSLVARGQRRPAWRRPDHGAGDRLTGEATLAFDAGRRQVAHSSDEYSDVCRSHRSSPCSLRRVPGGYRINSATTTLPMTPRTTPPMKVQSAIRFPDLRNSPICLLCSTVSFSISLPSRCSVSAPRSSAIFRASTSWRLAVALAASARSTSSLTSASNASAFSLTRRSRAIVTDSDAATSEISSSREGSRLGGSCSTDATTCSVASRKASWDSISNASARRATKVVSKPVIKPTTERTAPRMLNSWSPTSAMTPSEVATFTANARAVLTAVVATATATLAMRLRRRRLSRSLDGVRESSTTRAPYARNSAESGP